MTTNSPNWVRWSAADHVEESNRLVTTYQRTTRDPDALVIAQIHATLAVSKSVTSGFQRVGGE